MAITPQKTREARKLLQVQGIAKPSGAQIRERARQIDQQATFQKAQSLVEATKQAALSGARTLRPRAGTISIGGPISTAPPTPGRTITIGGQPTPSQIGARPFIGMPTVPPAAAAAPSSPFERRIITPSPELTAPAFQLQLQQILANRIAARNQPLLEAGRSVAGGLATLPETTAALPGFAGLTLSQARRLQDIEQAGLGSVFEGLAGTLERRGTRVRELGELAGRAFGEERERAETVRKEERQERLAKEQILEKRRQSAINDFTNFRDILREGGIVLDPKIGPEFMQKIITSDNPEQILEDYKNAAFGTEKVKKLFAPKGRAKTTISSDIAADLLNAILDDEGNIDVDALNKLSKDQQAAALQALADLNLEAQKVAKTALPKKEKRPIFGGPLPGTTPFPGGTGIPVGGPFPFLGLPKA